MSELELRASDEDRERTVMALREHAAAGRLTLEEFTQRMTAAYEARTSGELDELARDLPAARTASRRKVTRFLLSIFSSTERGGRLRIRRRLSTFVLFGNVDLDLRNATFERDTITIFMCTVFGAADVYVPEGVEVDLHGLSIFAAKDLNGEDVAPQLGMPLVRVYAFSLFAGVDVWLVPRTWASRTLREIIGGIRKGEQRKELTQ